MAQAAAPSGRTLPFLQRVIMRGDVALAALVLGILAILLWFSYKRIWRKVEH